LAVPGLSIILREGLRRQPVADAPT
ncbi:MAG: hypothetical protein QOG80_1413, partial [Pseudonocardiales bacterium]|nr:hypothetical protein [Pseudonocardiales bacterium]